MKTKRKNAKKRLHKGKKIETKKALFMGLQPNAPQPYLTYKLDNIMITSVPPPAK